jgi:paraquat-inducible protein B
MGPTAGLVNGFVDIGKASKEANGGVKAFGTGGALARVTAEAQSAADAAEALAESEKDLSSSSSGATKAIQVMNPRLRAQIDLVKELTGKVTDAGKALQSARDDMNNWISSMSQSILSGVNLGAAFDQMDDVNQAGEKIGVSLLEGFQKQIDQAGIFGGYLKQLNSEGGPELRDAVAALGPEAGNQLAKEIIDKGLIKTMQSKLVDVQSMAETTAAEMVPPMLVAGVQSAAGYLMTMQAELDESSALLAEMGRKMGATLTEAMVKEIRDALAAAGFAQSGATAIMAGTASQAGTGMSQSNLIAGSPFLNNTSIAQAIARAIEDSNQRLGRTGQAVLQ